MSCGSIRLRSLAIAFALLGAVAARGDATVPLPCVGTLAQNPVTDRIFVVCDDQIGVLDGATLAGDWIPLPPSVERTWNPKVDPIHDRLLVGSEDGLLVFDGPELALRTFTGPYAWVETFWVLDPAAGALWSNDGEGVDRVDLSDFSSVQAAPGDGRVTAIDAAKRRIYAVRFTPSRPDGVEIDADTFATRTLPTFTVSDEPIRPEGLRVNPAQARIYGYNDGASIFGYAIYDQETLAPLRFKPEPQGFQSLMVAIDSTRGRVWFAGPFSFPSLAAYDGGDLAFVGPSMSFAENYRVGFDWNPVTNRAFVLKVERDNTEPPSLVVWDLDALATDPIPFAGATAHGVMADLVRSRALVTVTSSGAPELRVIDEPETQPVPITTALSNDPPDSQGNVVFHYSATTAFAPYAPPITAIWTRVDSVHGPWTRVADDGAATFALRPGPHTVYAFATDGQEADSARPIVGPLARLEIRIPHGCDNGFDDDADGATDFPSDPDCLGRWQDNESSPPAHAPVCGLGAELALVLLGLRRLRRD